MRSDAETPETMPDLDDRRTRWVGIPGFGVIIPNVTDLFGTLGPRDWQYWLGYAWFVGLAWLIWHGNRWLLFQQRRHVGWFDHPVQKILLLLFGIVCYTAPLTVIVLVGWYGWSGLGDPDFAAIESTMLINVICVVFVAHVYETVFLIKDRESDIVKVTRLERARAEAQLDALRTQIDPHFLFNSLNTLNHLIEVDPARARVYNETLARVYRYILTQRNRDLVLLTDELAFVRDYGHLLELRFGAALRIEIVDDDGLAPKRFVVPVSLQVLVENAVKHTVFDEARPLTVTLEIGPRSVTVTNPRRPKAVRESSRVGLSNLDERHRLVIGERVTVTRTETSFAVEIPTVQAA